MALKIKNTTFYIVIDLQGNYKIYKSALYRKKEKEGKFPQNIMTKYEQIIDEISFDAERRYYDPTYYEDLEAWRTEYQRYRDDFYNNVIGNKYPLMKQHFKDVEKSINYKVSSGGIWVKGNTLKEVYKYVKEQKYFGETEDC